MESSSVDQIAVPTQGIVWPHIQALKSLFFCPVTRTSPFIVSGSHATIDRGCAVTRNEVGNCPPGWVPSDSTIIVGCSPQEADRAEQATHVDWLLPIDPRTARKASNVVLVIGCHRVHGGLHCRIEGRTATVLVNGEQVDYIRLVNIPSGHIDYFHTMAGRDIPALPALGILGTAYWFSVDPPRLIKDRRQKVSVATDPGVFWDIDHVALVLECSQARLRPWVVNAVFTALGAILTLLVQAGWNTVF